MEYNEMDSWTNFFSLLILDGIIGVVILCKELLLCVVCLEMGCNK